jgi:hypothetical protein
VRPWTLPHQVACKARKTRPRLPLETGLMQVISDVMCVVRDIEFAARQHDNCFLIDLCEVDALATESLGMIWSSACTAHHRSLIFKTAALAVNFNFENA